MELWTEYEGRTIDGDFPLTKLLRPEGRSAFFSTTNGTGLPTVIRLIESHFDDDEILARWRGVTELNQPNLVNLKKCGQVELDGTSLVYAVMEPVEANLGEIVSLGRLTVPEARQIATSLVAALEALHSHGYVHDHVEPANVMAVGDVVKLRSDCIRDVSEEREDGRRQKRKDVHDLAVVLLQAMTQQKTLEGAKQDMPLAAPFDEIVRKGISGEWGLEEISKALEATAPRQVVTPKKAEAVLPVAAAVVAGASASGKEASRVATTANVSTPASTPAPAVTAAVIPEKKVVEMPRPEMPRNVNRVSVPVEDDLGPGRGMVVKLLMAVAALLVIWIGWHLLRGKSTESQNGAAPVAARPAPIVNGSASGTPEVVNAPEVEGTRPAPVAPSKRSAAIPVGGPVVHGEQWRVVAFTYNHQDQAQHKAESLAQEHPDLKPQVFTPTGRAPYLVTLGGAMNKDQAFAFSGKAKREGLPKDIYAQNYRAQTR